MIIKSYYDSPFGALKIEAQNDFLVSLSFAEAIAEKNKDNPFVLKIKKQLDEYFNQKRKVFDIDLKLSGTDFQKRVYKGLLKIPYGKTYSYQELATMINHKNAQRALGSACKKNKIVIIVPCHRVIAKSRNIGGYNYGTAIKKSLLELEGAI